jgi:hypothetical protein
MFSLFFSTEKETQVLKTEEEPNTPKERVATPTG